MFQAGHYVIQHSECSRSMPFNLLVTSISLSNNCMLWGNEQPKLGGGDDEGKRWEKGGWGVVWMRGRASQGNIVSSLPAFSLE